MSTKASEKFKRSKAWLPALSGISTMLFVLILLNSQFIASRYITITKKPIDASAKDSQEESSSNESKDPKITINSIEIEAPIDFNQSRINEDSFQESLKNGVVHYPFTAKPGERGNVVIFGHSSGQIWAPGNYKFIFSRLEQLKKDDKVFISYQGVKYIYKIDSTTIVAPTDVSVLQPTNDNTLTLITCHPVGSNAERLIVRAKQISPDPNQANQNYEPVNSYEGSLPGNSRSTWESLKLLFN